MTRPRPCLNSIAPRLARARDQHEHLAGIAYQQHRKRVQKRLELERLVAHRELQLVRAQHRGNARYIAERQRKLSSAQRALARLA